MGVLLLRSNDLPSLRVLYFCLLTYSSNIEVSSALSGPSVFLSTLTSCSAVDYVIWEVSKCCRRILTLSIDWTRRLLGGWRIDIYAYLRLRSSIACNICFIVCTTGTGEDVSRSWGYSIAK